MRRINKKNILLIFFIIAILFILFEHISNVQATEGNEEIANTSSTIQEVLQYVDLNEEFMNEGNSQYDSNGDGGIILWEYYGDCDSVVIPKELNGFPIKQIDSNAFLNCTNLELIKIPLEIFENIENINGFEIEEELSNEEYIIYVSTKEYNPEYIRYIKLNDEQRSKVQVIPEKFIRTSEDGGIMLFAEIPSKYDLRDRITIDVDYQSIFGICYAYATTKSIETNIALNYENITKNFSEIHMAIKSKELYGGLFKDCYNKYLKYGYGPVEEIPNTILSRSYVESHPDEIGANIYNAMYNNNISLSDEEIEAAISKLDALNPSQEYYAMQYRSFNSYYGDKKADSEYKSEIEEKRNLMKQCIMENGSVTAYIAGIEEKNYKYYDSYPVFCQKNKMEAGESSHLVSIIGWDDNFSASRFPSSFGVTEDGAYLALNSWGSNWGDNGTFWISYQDYYVDAFNEAIVDVSNSKVNLNDTDISLSTDTCTYDGNVKTPAIKLIYNNNCYIKDTDYTVSYNNNINVGTGVATITGKGRFTGTVRKNFTITPKPINKLSITLGKNNYTYDGTEKTPSVTIKDGSKTLINRKRL